MRCLEVREELMRQVNLAHEDMALSSLEQAETFTSLFIHFQALIYLIISYYIIYIICILITKASFAGLELPRLLNEVKYSI